MNKLSCLEHLSTLSFSTEMSEMLLHRKKTKETQTVTEVWVYKGSIKTLQSSCKNNHTPHIGKLGPVFMPVNETEEDLQHQQTDFWILG